MVINNTLIIYRFDAIYNFLYKMLFWNMILRMILEGYLEFAINSITNL
jgi:hypothetical protein